MDGWIEADLGTGNKKKEAVKVVVDLDDEEDKGKKKILAKDIDIDNLDDSDEEEPEEKKKEEDIEDAPVSKLKAVKTRTYDVSVTYDFYYCVPRMWLFGYDEEGKILTKNQMLEDVMKENRDTTCTISEQPCTGQQNLSIHPCKHSSLLKKMIASYEKNGEKLDVEKSVLLFLKFLQSIVPTVQYDFTMDMKIYLIDTRVIKY